VFEKSAMEFPNDRSDRYSESAVTGASLLGFSVGYHTHFLSKLGYEAGIKVLGA
jgi:hypothetical protein